MHTDRCGNTCRQKCCAKGSGKEVKIQEFVYRDTANVEPEMYDCTGNNWSHWNSNEKLKEKFGSCTGKTFDRFTTKDSCTWNITHNTESTAVWSLKRERWVSPLVQEKYREEMACDKRQPYRLIIIIIIIIITTGIVTRSLRKHLEAVPGKHSIDSLQKTATLGTSHIIRKVLQCEAWSVSGGDHCWFERSTGKKWRVTGDSHIV